MSEAKWMRAVVIAVLVAGVGMYAVEHYLLSGQPVAGGTANISDINSSPSFPISLLDADQTIRVYLAAQEGDMRVGIEVLDPSNQALVQRSAELGKLDFTFEAETAGIYHVRLTSAEDRGRIAIEAFTNDRRLFSGCF